MKLFADIANEYADQVVTGEVDACLYVRQACQRHLDDLAKSKGKGYPYAFDADIVQKICTFAEMTPHVKGDWAARGELITLEPWQVFQLSCIFAWVKSDGMRRFRLAYSEIPRKNSKSTLGAIAGKYALTADGEFGAEVCCAATTEMQAHFVFKSAWQMVYRNPDLQDFYGIELGGTYKNPGPIYIEETNSLFEAIVGQARDGASTHFAVIDEFHEHKSDGLFQSISTGMKARRQPLIWVITTAGSDTAGPCYAMRSDAIKMLNGSLDDPTTFAIIYTVDEGDEWATEAALRKANPNFGVSVNVDSLLTDMRRAVNSARLQNDFKTKHLNLWVGAKASWMNMEKWGRCGDSLKIYDFAGEKCWIGVDLSQRNDFTSVVHLFKRGDRYYLFSRHYLPEAQIMEPDHHHYQGWEHDKHLISIPGDVIDYDTVLKDIVKDQESFNIVALGYDPYYAHTFALDLIEAGVNAIEVKQVPSRLTEAMTDLEGEVLAEQLRHDDNPCMNWMMGNVVVKSHSRYGVKPDKERKENKIDGATAAIMAMVMEHAISDADSHMPTGVLLNF